MPPRIGWSFPSNNHGREDGLNDPGIETFRNDPLRSLSKEGAQNTSDAADEKSGKPVEIRFELLDLPMETFPDAGHFQQMLKACENYWSTNAAARKFFKNALKLMKGDTVRVLKMSDYNTTGLLGPVDDRTSDWFKLTKAVGSSDKAGGAGGSFGIGKHAPFACSELRTVLYGTKDKNGQYAFQGVSKLVTHLNRENEPTQGTGYCGIKSKNTPITDPDLVEKVFRRTETGTDVFILGFLRDADWVDQITKGLIENFFVAIHEGRLRARVGPKVLNSNSLHELIENYSADDKHWAARPYYEALTSEDTSFFYEDDFNGLGRVEVRVLPGKDYPKQVAMCRSSGMKIFDKRHFHTPVRFAGVFLAKGAELNVLLKSLEPPSHDKWEHKRADDSQYAKGVLRDMYEWVHDKVRTLSAEQGLEALDPDGLSHYLPDDLDDLGQATDEVAEGERSEPEAEIVVQTRVRDKAEAIVTVAPFTGGADDGEDLASGGEGSGYGEGEGGGDGGDGSGVKEGGDDGDSGARDSDGRSAPASRPISLGKVRVYCSDPSIGRYRIMVEPQATGQGYLDVYVVGEVGQLLAPISEIWLAGAKSPDIPTKPGSIGPLDMEKGKRLAVDVVLEGALHCALGVSAHEN